MIAIHPNIACGQAPCLPAKNVRSAAVLFIAVLGAAGFAADPTQPGINFADLSIEELMNESVTSVSKREQRLGDVASAITVLSHEDIRRSGSTSVPEALRWVPGMNVGANNAREWAVGVRGFNNVYSNKLLALADGRTIYSPLFSGVYWDLQQPMLEDIDRIEVIRGPGATIWGANAVNGVINIVTLSARETQGGLLYAMAGDALEAGGGVRYGGMLDDKTYFRVFATGQWRGDHRQSNGQSAEDHWRGRHAGFRMDRYPDEASQLTWQGEVTDTDFDGGIPGGHNLNTLARWRRTLSGRSSVEVQAYYDRIHRREILRSGSTIDTFDVQAQQTLGVGERHDFVGGFGARFSSNEVTQTNAGSPVINGDFKESLVSAFLQDEFRIVPDRLTLTAGIKAEHNDFTGLEFQPSLRAVYKPSINQTWWGAVSRAIRTPNSLEARELFLITVGGPVVGPDGGLYFPTLAGNPALDPEVIWSWELGYRVQMDKRVSVDAALYYSELAGVISWGGNDFSRFVSGVPFGRADYLWSNVFHVNSHGAELTVTTSPSDRWRLVAGGSYQVQRDHGPPNVLRNAVQSPPRWQLTMRSSHDLTARLEFDIQLRYAAAIPATPFYIEADVRLAWRPDERLELSLVGQDLLDAHHPEQSPVVLTVASEVPRRFYGKLTWRF